MMVNDAGDLPLSLAVWCSEYHMSWESEIDGYQNVQMDRWNSIKYHEMMETQLKLGHRSKLIQSQITNMQILKESVSY